jgi:hypothetical protein
LTRHESISQRELLPPPGTKITLACCASRASFAAVTSQLLRRLASQGVSRRYDLHLVVVHAKVDQLNLAGLTASVDLQALTVIEQESNSYAARRNQALATALEADGRYLFFYDDDEHWVRPTFADDKMGYWRTSDPLIPHLAGLAAGAAITCGVTLGQVSPVPQILPQQTDHRYLVDLGHALRFGSEFLHRRSFVEDAGRWRRRTSCRLDAPMLPRRGILPLTGGNLAIDLHAMRAGDIPPYYNPPVARGEDALLGARVRHLPVRRVSACSFHDPFGRMHCADDGEPISMARQTADSGQALQRFADALCGWVGYAPLLVRLGGGLRIGLSGAQRLETLQRVIDDVSEPLAQDLGCPQLTGLPALLAARRQAVTFDHEQMQRQAARWWQRWRVA